MKTAIIINRYFFVVLLFALFTSYTASANAQIFVGSIDVPAQSATAVSGCSWGPWIHKTMGRERFFSCYGENVAQIFHNMAMGDCSAGLLQTGYTMSGSSSSCQRVISQLLVTQSLPVRRHVNAPSLTNAEADNILHEASMILTHDDGPGDVVCNVRLIRNDNVGTFSTGDGAISNNEDFNALQPGFNLVDSIPWCGTLIPNIIGCADLPGERIAVVKLSDLDLEGVLWAHERGHNLDLGHRSDTYAVMRGTVHSVNRRIDSSECVAFR